MSGVPQQTPAGIRRSCAVRARVIGVAVRLAAPGDIEKAI